MKRLAEAVGLPPTGASDVGGRQTSPQPRVRPSSVVDSRAALPGEQATTLTQERASNWGAQDVAYVNLLVDSKVNQVSTATLEECRTVAAEQKRSNWLFAITTVLLVLGIALTLVPWLIVQRTDAVEARIDRRLDHYQSDVRALAHAIHSYSTGQLMRLHGVRPQR